MIEKVAIVALLLWLVQLALAYRQARLFYKRISSLRKRGPSATGLAGGRYRGRAYVVLVVHPTTHKVIAAEVLQGLTVFARLKPVVQLEGRSLEELANPETPGIEGISPKVQEATRMAAEAIQKSLNKMPVTA
ncbi:MAG TPA: transcriptional regulator GutM [Ktedonobacteraceae bacterium]|jgi:glucitol operon activator protein|nr:transcriptional regulator GutM [Ktedonobacteraceae bacterium]